MVNYRTFIVPLCVAALALQPALASNHAGCGTKDGASSTQKTVSFNYSKNVQEQKLDMNQKSDKKKKAVMASKSGKMDMLKMMLKKSSKANLQKVWNTLERFSDTVPSTNPNYYMIEDLMMYIEDLLSNMETPTDSIVDIVVNTPQVSILKDVVVALDLVDTLNSEGPFTVFAPTNAAFEKLLAELGMSFDELAQNTELLKTVVLYHVVGAKVPASAVMNLTEGTLVETLGGEEIRVSNWDGVKVDDSNVVAADIMTKNGVIHLIDEVLLPPSVRASLGLLVDRGDENIVTTAVESNSFPTLIAAVQAAGLVDVLSSEGPFTVFAPTEEAFAALLVDLNMSATELLSDTELLTKVLTYHVVPGFYSADDVLGLDMPIYSPTVEGSSLTIDPNNGSPMVNDSAIVATDVFASNGVIHVIDKVLIPSM